MKSDQNYLLKNEYHECFGPANVEWFVGKLMKLENKLKYQFNSIEANQLLLMSKTADKKIERAKEYGLSETTFTPLYGKV